MGIGFGTKRSQVRLPAGALPKKQLLASCSHLRACVGARGLVVGVDS